MREVFLSKISDVFIILFHFFIIIISANSKIKKIKLQIVLQFFSLDNSTSEKVAV